MLPADVTAVRRVWLRRAAVFSLLSARRILLLWASLFKPVLLVLIWTCSQNDTGSLTMLKAHARTMFYFTHEASEHILFYFAVAAVTATRWTSSRTRARARSATWRPRCSTRPSTSTTSTPTSRPTSTRSASCCGRSRGAPSSTVRRHTSLHQAVRALCTLQKSVYAN